MKRLAPVLLLVACQSSSTDDATQARGESLDSTPWLSRRTSDAGFPCDVDVALAHGCRRCHWDPRENDAPFGFTSWNDLQKEYSGKPVHVLMKQMLDADLMPPLDALVVPPVKPLDPDHEAALSRWLGAGAPKSAEKCAL